MAVIYSDIARVISLRIIIIICVLLTHLFTSDKGGSTCFFPCLFVCLSVSKITQLLRNACMDLDETLLVDRCREMDELINF